MSTQHIFKFIPGVEDQFVTAVIRQDTDIRFAMQTPTSESPMTLDYFSVITLFDNHELWEYLE